MFCFRRLIPDKAASMCVMIVIRGYVLKTLLVLLERLMMVAMQKKIKYTYKESLASRGRVARYEKRYSLCM